MRRCKVFLGIFACAHGFASLLANNALCYDEQLVFEVLTGVFIGAVADIAPSLCSGSLWPCIVFHGLFNALSAFTDDAAIIAAMGSELGEALLILGIIAVAGGAYLLYLRKMPSVLED